MREAARRYRNFDEFYGFYLGEHAHPVSRRLHVAGTGLALLLVLLAAGLRQPWLLVAALACGYGLAWTGHFFFEKNRPATFTHPWWSLRGDFRLLAETLAGRRKW
ncbi:DUF962 domain-containing protein [Pigmentiphaga sp. GD03639]|uniref:DUF962 domain-containing protein n=1 Tax=Pigmentiphaga daeguensis TaxID=414049 RepID=A0ABP3L8W6_9BURK|nr:MULTISPECIES: DUF962 domain-containing protein [unclassified Pigmentiphaga]MDH2237537.1 DUF962 domain-containing protein [Pigmentiphaga sp. GD03639]OVZ58537.1 hypothetical protein CDO46_25125 [Pigmentiphaga sp. NML030171]